MPYIITAAVFTANGFLPIITRAADGDYTLEEAQEAALEELQGVEDETAEYIAQMRDEILNLTAADIEGEI